MEGVIFRPGSRLVKLRMHEILDKAGMGDNICRAPALAKLLEQPHVYLSIFAPKPHVPLFEHWFGDHPRVEQVGSIQDAKFITSDKDIYPRGFDTTSIKIPYHDHTYHRVHPVDHGARMIANRDLEDRSYLQISPDAANIAKFDLPTDYAVLAMGHTWTNRTFKGSVANQVADYLNSKGITPVFLGKKNIDHNAPVSWAGVDRTKGIDLTSEGDDHKTTLLESSVILRYAKVVIGVDQGLHHLAGCSGDVPIVVGYTVTHPDTRMPIRHNSFHNVFPLTPDLPCRFCMTNMNILHDFSSCVYGDNLCVPELTYEKFRVQIDKALESGALDAANTEDGTGD